MNDYATIVLLDCRYSQENIVKKLPKWILPSLRVCKNFGDAYKGCVQVGDFYLMITTIVFQVY